MAEEEATVAFFSEEMLDDARFQRLDDFLALVTPGAPWEIPTEWFLRLNGNSRRGKQVNSTIQSLLQDRGLITTPSIEKADYYGTIVVADPRDSLPERASIGSLPISAFQGGDLGLIFAGPDMAAKKVETLMIKDDFSQIPVLSKDRKHLYGVVTWRSLARYRGDLTVASAKNVMETGWHVASSSDDLLGLVATIVANDFVLYRDPEGAVTGIVTSSDLAQAFDDLSGVYIRIGEIEDRLRMALDRAPIPALKKHLDPKYGNRKGFRGATDMMFGEYLRALADDDIWACTYIDLDKATCLKLLETVKEARNKVMHFNSELPPDMIDAVDQLLRILRSTSTR